MTENPENNPDQTPRGISPADVEIFDPPMCCPTGLCGPTVDQTLLDVNELIVNLRKSGLRVRRYQMAANPKAYTNNADVMRLVRDQQMDALPITVVRGTLVKSGAYPSIEEIQALLGKPESAL